MRSNVIGPALAGCPLFAAWIVSYHDNPAASPAVRMAENLLAEAEACPALIARSDPVAVALEPPSGQFPALALLSDPALDVRPYLEDLVSIAAASAQRAEQLAFQARRAIRQTRYQMLVVGCLGAAALLIGVTGFAISRNGDAKLAQMTSELIALTHQQQQAQGQIAALTAQAEARAVGPTAREPKAVVVLRCWQSRPCRHPVFATPRSPGLIPVPCHDEALSRRTGQAAPTFLPGFSQACRQSSGNGISGSSPR